MKFYPQFCIDCQTPFISKDEYVPCPKCGSENVVNYKREIYHDMLNMQKRSRGLDD